MHTSTIFVLLGLSVSSALAANALNLSTNFFPFYIFSSPTIEDGERCRAVYESDITGCTDTVDFMNGAFCTPLCKEALRQVQQKLGEACEGVVPEDRAVLERIMQYRLVESICSDGGSGHNPGLPAPQEEKKLEGHWGGGSEATASTAGLQTETGISVMPFETKVLPSSTVTSFMTAGTVTVSSEEADTVTISTESATTSSVFSVVGSNLYGGIEFTAVQVIASFDGGAEATSTDTSPPTATPTQDSQTSAESAGSLSFAAKVGIGAGSGSVLLTITLVAWVIKRRKRRSKKAALAAKSPGGPRRRLLEDEQPSF